MFHLWWKVSSIILFTAILLYEAVHVVHSYTECYVERMQSENLVASPNCLAGGGGGLLGRQQELLCEGAHAALQVPTFMCVGRNYWLRSWVRIETLRLYNMYAESYLMLFGLGSVAICAVAAVVYFLLKGMTMGSSESETKEKKRRKREKDDENTGNLLSLNTTATLLLMNQLQQQQMNMGGLLEKRKEEEERELIL